LEFVWWLITAIVAMTILLPICIEVENYPFFWDNLLFIVAFITFTRLIFFLRYSLIADKKKIKAALFFISIFIVFMLVQKVNQFQIDIDENGIDAMLGNSISDNRQGLMNYIRQEMLFFGVGGAISGILLPFRLMKSIWQDFNK